VLSVACQSIHKLEQNASYPVERNIQKQPVFTNQKNPEKETFKDQLGAVHGRWLEMHGSSMLGELVCMASRSLCIASNQRKDLILMMCSVACDVYYVYAIVIVLTSRWRTWRRV
jgi:hypothetical protein